MNKNFIILGDCHIGSRGASPILCEYQISFFENVLFPYMENNKIKTILQLGDLMDTRKFSNHVILHQWKKRVFDVMRDKGYEMVALLGNHDSSLRNTLSINSPSILLSEYDNLIIIDTPIEKEIEGVNFLLVPWICSENEQEISDAVKKTSAVFCAGHFEFDGFEMQRGIPSHGGTSSEAYSYFDVVFSGHYHTKSKKKNVLYVGTPYEQTWADYDDPKGFHVFSPKSNKVSYIKNPECLFTKCFYDDSDGDATPPKITKNSFVKVIVENKTDPYKFEKYLTNIISQSPSDLKITEMDSGIDSTDVAGSDLKLDDTPTLMSKFVDQCESSLDKNKLKKILNSLYTSSLEICD